MNRVSKLIFLLVVVLVFASPTLHATDTKISTVVVKTPTKPPPKLDPERDRHRSSFLPLPCTISESLGVNVGGSYIYDIMGFYFYDDSGTLVYTCQTTFEVIQYVNAVDIDLEIKIECVEFNLCGRIMASQ